MAWRQRHLVYVSRIPGGDYQAAGIRIALDHRRDMGDLIDGLAVLRRPRAPLPAVNRPEIAAGIGPLVPDPYAVVVEIFDVGVAGQEPQQFVDDRLQVELLGRRERKAMGEIKAHLMAEYGNRAGAGAIAFLDAVRQHMFHQFKILSHRSASVATQCLSASLAPDGSKTKACRLSI